ncbi:phosphoglyceromutase [Candidatus Haloredivivus sp. G17]|nr:phosphoglyceromutase [Candidatus Haloredivivus sp. G17]
MGRFYSMDRDHNWERTHQAYDAMALGEGFEFENPREAVKKAYEDGEYDVTERDFQDEIESIEEKIGGLEDKLEENGSDKSGR